MKSIRVLSTILIFFFCIPFGAKAVEIIQYDDGFAIVTTPEDIRDKSWNHFGKYKPEYNRTTPNGTLISYPSKWIFNGATSATDFFNTYQKSPEACFWYGPYENLDGKGDLHGVIKFSKAAVGNQDYFKWANNRHGKDPILFQVDLVSHNEANLITHGQISIKMSDLAPPPPPPFRGGHQNWHELPQKQVDLSAENLSDIKLVEMRICNVDSLISLSIEKSVIRWSYKFR